MIDIESQVFTRVKQAILAAYPDALVSSAYVDAPAQFPCVFLLEMNNTADLTTRTSSSNENHAVLMYQVDIYSAKAQGKKAEARAIAALTDAAMQDMGFTRTMLQPVMNAADPSIFRYTGRYDAVVGKNQMIYRR